MGTCKEFQSLLAFFFCIVGMLLCFVAKVEAAPDPNFHIYIAYGQSNMAGAGEIQSKDKVEHPRYKMFATTACSGLGRPTVGEIYPAIPPMFHCGEGLSVADWFGRNMADSMPGVTIGIIPVAVGGTSIKLFDKDQYVSYLSKSESWLVNWAKDYGSDGNAFGRIVEIGKKAQEVGVIKGIIFHQGETDGGYGDWEKIVKKSRDDLFVALNLSADTVPFLAGEMLEGGCCYSFALNRVSTLPDKMENTHVVKSTGLAGNGKDSYHFGNAGYVEFGRRYAEKMLEVMNKTPAVEIPQEPYGGTAASIPGKVEAENFDLGNRNKTYYDSDTKNEGGTYREEGVDIEVIDGGGYAVGYTKIGEWLKYTIQVIEAGEYEVMANVASGSTSSAFILSVDDNAIGAVTVPQTADGAWNVYEQVSVGKVNLTLGAHELKLEITGDYVNIDWFSLIQSPAMSIGAKLSTDIAAEKGVFTLMDFQGRVLKHFSAQNRNDAVKLVKKGDVLGSMPTGVYIVISNFGTKNQIMQKIVVYEK